MKHYLEEELIAWRDGEPKGREEIRAHLEECSQCRAEMRKIEAVFAALDAMPVPDPGEDYGRRVWQQIAPRLPEKRAGWWVGLFSPGRLVTVAAVAAMLVLAFFLGRTTKTGGGSGPSDDVASRDAVRQRVLEVAVADHLSRSERVLMELAHARSDDAGGKLVNISAEQKRAEDLVDENRLYRQSAWEEGDAAMASTLDELERVLVDIANSPDEVTAEQFDSIQRRIDSRGILLKVRVVKEGLRDRLEKSDNLPAHNQPAVQERSKV
jgi:hypothetical protein